MTDYYLKNIRGKVLRVTKLNACGAPVVGPKNAIVTNGFIKVDLKPQVENGTDYKVVNANDELVINDRGRNKIRWWDLGIDLIGVNPYLHNFLTGSPLVMNDVAATPEAVGISMRSGPIGTNFALEIWTDLDGQACDPAGNQMYGYTVLAFCKDGMIGDASYENGPINFPITGARVVTGSQWATGPFEVLNAMSTGAGVPSKLLTPIAADEGPRLFMTTLAPPVPAVAPIAVPA